MFEIDRRSFPVLCQSSTKPYFKARYQPSVVIVTVNVEHFFAFHAQNTTQLLAMKVSDLVCEFTPRERIPSGLRRGQYPSATYSLYNVPVPRTTMSYSGAISSMANLSEPVYEVKYLRLRLRLRNTRCCKTVGCSKNWSSLTGGAA